MMKLLTQFFGRSSGLRRARRDACTVLVWAGALFGAQTGQATQPLYLCPGNLFTNQINSHQAREAGCRVVQPSGVTQATLGRSEAPPAPPPPVEIPGAAPVRAAAVLLPAVRAKTPPARPTPAEPAVAKPLPAGAKATTVSVQVQRERDRDAQTILQAELARTLGALRTLSAQAPLPDSAPNPAGNPVATEIHRLRSDELALRRELDRLRP